MLNFTPKFVTLGDVHFNTYYICGFAWSNGVLHVVDDTPETTDIADPDRDVYLHLCETFGVDPV